jgi:hypothetical protein
VAKLMQLFIQFAGSFQARLAVGMDPSASSPTDPYGTYGLKSGGAGATCAYRETPFDRIIRLSKPVDLRNARIDPWTDTTVKSVLINAGKELVPAPPGSPFQGQVISLGDKVKWIEGSDGYQLDGLELSIGSFLAGGKPIGELSPWVDPKPAPPVDPAEYSREKPKRIQAVQGQLDEVRARVLQEVEKNEWGAWPAFFKMTAEYDFGLIAQSLQLRANFGSSGAMDLPSNYYWTVNLVFSRWDPDTLGGQVSGAIYATHFDVLRAGLKGVADVAGMIKFSLEKMPPWVWPR